MKRRYSDLLVWQKAHALAIDAYEASKSLPKDELYGLISQIRRAAVSIPTNIVEGQSRSGQNEFGKFLSISRASTAELDYLLLLSKDLGMLSPEVADNLCEQCDEIIRMLTGLINSIK